MTPANSPSRPPKNALLSLLGAGVALLVLAYMAASAVSVAERLYIINGRSYPSFLLSGNLGVMTESQVAGLRDGPCKHDPVEILPKDGFVVLRCGMWWTEPSTRTYRVERLIPDIFPKRTGT